MLDIKKVEREIGYEFKNKKLLISAMTHKSYANDKKLMDIDSYNERLEFLGDAILEHAVSIYLFNVTPKLKEGVMSKKRSEIVCEKSLSNAMINMQLDKFINLGNCELAIDGRKNVAILADMAEAIIAAVYLDSDFEHANQVITKMLGNTMKEVLALDANGHDYKTKLQELLQKNGTVNIQYVLDKEEGEAHNKMFFSSVYFENRKIGEGCGKTKKASEQEAAKKALEDM